MESPRVSRPIRVTGKAQTRRVHRVNPVDARNEEPRTSGVQGLAAAKAAGADRATASCQDRAPPSRAEGPPRSYLAGGKRIIDDACR